MSDPKDELAGTEQPFVQHLLELRDRLVRAMIVLIVACVILSGTMNGEITEVAISLLPAGKLATNGAASQSYKVAGPG